MTGKVARKKKEKYIELSPKNDSGKKRLSYHGNRWVLKRETDTPPQVYLRSATGSWIFAMSRDGKIGLWVNKDNDSDFNVRMLT